MVVINRVYTRSGDGGYTSLVGGKRVAKDDLQLECCGTIDELNSSLGLVISLSVPDGNGSSRALRLALLPVQQRLFDLGAELATPISEPCTTALEEKDILWLENAIDTMNKRLPTLKSFVLPGGGRLGSQLHQARTICRRAERLCVRWERESKSRGRKSLALMYLNRLSDWLFVLARWCSQQTAAKEVLWQPRQDVEPFQF